MATSSPRAVVDIVRGMPTSDGAGVRLNRVIGSRRLPEFDPFLLLDEFRSDQAGDYIAGFPDHPHRGFETVTYMLAGSMQHRDSVGNTGNLVAGSVQWMTAGRGIIHSEMPRQEEGLMWGFQLWVNLPARLKMTAPRYQDIAPEAIPEVSLPGGATVRVLAGTVAGVEGPVRDIVTRPVLLDIAVPEGATATVDVEAEHNAFVYVFEGAGRFAGTAVDRGGLATLSAGDHLEVHGGPVRFLLAVALPLGEPIARYGPFVMNTRAEIETAVSDYRSGRLTG